MRHPVSFEIDPEVHWHQTWDSFESAPEVMCLIPYCEIGHGIDVGCGARKTHPNCIGIDILPKGELGKYGCMAGQPSAADICCSGDDLPFEDEELDFVVSRHNLEHYLDIIKALLEWKRVLKVGGVMAHVLPDDRVTDMLHIDQDHKHSITPESFVRYIDLIRGFVITKLEVVRIDWSFLCVARKVDENIHYRHSRIPWESPSR